MPKAARKQFFTDSPLLVQGWDGLQSELQERKGLQKIAKVLKVATTRRSPLQREKAIDGQCLKGKEERACERD